MRYEYLPLRISIILLFAILIMSVGSDSAFSYCRDCNPPHPLDSAEYEGKTCENIRNLEFCSAVYIWRDDYIPHWSWWKPPFFNRRLQYYEVTTISINNITVKTNFYLAFQRDEIPLHVFHRNMSLFKKVLWGSEFTKHLSRKFDAATYKLDFPIAFHINSDIIDCEVVFEDLQIVEYKFLKTDSSKCERTIDDVPFWAGLENRSIKLFLTKLEGKWNNYDRSQ